MHIVILPDPDAVASMPPLHCNAIKHAAQPGLVTGSTPPLLYQQLIAFIAPMHSVFPT